VRRGPARPPQTAKLDRQGRSGGFNISPLHEVRIARMDRSPIPRPNALAVCSLITNSNSVDCTTGAGVSREMVPWKDKAPHRDLHT
jgi:hypothetical protein